jgi:glycosyltransferase involved in cell wall biosynthesis
VRERRASIIADLVNRTWLVVPLFNESQVIGDVVREALKTFPKIVCVDDGSSDDSGKRAEEAGAVVVTHPINLGQGAALRTGLDYALQDPSADYFVTFDSDGQHRVEDALSMVEMIESGDFDAVIGSRFLDGRTKMGPVKRVVLKLAIAFERMSTGVKLTDAHNGLRVLNRIAATRIRIVQNRMAHASEIVAELGRAKLRYAEFPVHIVYTDYSRSKGQSVWNAVNILSDLFFK